MFATTSQRFWMKIADNGVEPSERFPIQAARFGTPKIAAQRIDNDKPSFS
jgi:hypothetical protein